MTSVPKTMRAWVFRKSGQPVDVLQLEPSWPVPSVGADKVLVAVHTAARNPGSSRFLSMFPLTMAVKKPAVPESDFSGTVVVADTKGTFAVGDRVCGSNFAQMFKGQGALAEYAPISTEQLVKIPRA